MHNHGERYFYPLREYLRPIKLFALFWGLMFLFAGALFSGLPDWDIPVSLLMAFFAYLTAAPSMRVFLERRWRLAPYAAFWTWFTVDGTYLIYWGLRNPDVLELRYANAAASLALYGMCGLIWYHRYATGAEPWQQDDDWFSFSDENQYH